MKQKWFVLSAIGAIALISVFVFDHVTSAQRPERSGGGERANRGEGRRGGMGMMEAMNPVSIVENSWIDLTFGVKVNDETLVKARPIYQEIRDEVEMEMQTLRASGDRQQMMNEMKALVGKVGKEFQASLKEILSEAEMKQLNELTKKRIAANQERGNRFRGGGNRGR